MASNIHHSVKKIAGDYGITAIKRPPMPRGPAPLSIHQSIEGPSGRVSKGDHISRNIPNYSGRKYQAADEYEVGLGGGSSRKNPKFVNDPIQYVRAVPKVNPPVWWG